MAILWIGLGCPGCPTRIASADPVEPLGGPQAEPPGIPSPGLAAAGYGDWLWVIWLGTEPDENAAVQPQTHPAGETGRAQIVAMQTNHPWSEVRTIQVSRLLLAGARNDRLDMLFPSGGHFFYQPDGYSARLAPLPADFTPICLAANGSQLYALASRSGKAASQPDSMPDSGPVARSLHLLVQNGGEWKERPRLPNDFNLLSAGYASLTMRNNPLKPGDMQPVVLATVDGKLVYARLAEGDHWQVRPVQFPTTTSDQLGEVKAASINKSLYVVAWPQNRAGHPLVAQIEDATTAGMAGQAPLTADVHDLPAVQPDLDLKTRYRQWDIAVSNDRVVLLRKNPTELGPGLQVCHYDPGKRSFDDWQAVTGLGQTRDWVTELVHMPALLPILLSVMVLAFLIRRPGGMIRLPIDVEPARLWQRGLALFIDLIPAQMVAQVIAYGSDWDRYQRDLPAAMNGQPTRAVLLMFGLSLALLVVYCTVAETFFATTLGKRLFRLSVYSVTGTRPSFGQVLVRNLVKLFDVPLAWLVLAMMIFHPARQRMGDLLAGTIVVGPRTHPLPPWARPAPPSDRPPDRDDTPPGGPEDGD